MALIGAPLTMSRSQSACPPAGGTEAASAEESLADWVDDCRLNGTTFHDGGNSNAHRSVELTSPAVLPRRGIRRWFARSHLRSTLRCHPRWLRCDPRRRPSVLMEGLCD